jgi:protein SCO1
MSMPASPNENPPRISRASGLAGGLALIAALGLASWWAIDSSAAPPASLIGGPFKLEATDGRTLTDGDMKGAPYLVFFGYTHCPDICPATLAEISDAVRRLPVGKKIRTLFITIDPERDSVQSMKDYLSSFDAPFIGLTGDPAAIAQAEKSYRVYAKRVDGANGDYTMDHSAVVYLMDAKGRFVEAFNLERPPEESAKELASYL